MHRNRLIPFAAAIAALTVLSACGGGSGDSAKDWDPAALKEAAALADQVRKSGTPCTDYSPWDYKVLSTSLRDQSHLPVPAAVTNCTGDAKEDLTFQVFASTEKKDQFAKAKAAVLCKGATKAKISDMQVPYVDGPTWIMEPDTDGTNDKLAQVLGGKVAHYTCNGPAIAPSS